MANNNHHWTQAGTKPCWKCSKIKTVIIFLPCAAYSYLLLQSFIFHSILSYYILSPPPISLNSLYSQPGILTKFKKITLIYFKKKQIFRKFRIVDKICKRLVLNYFSLFVLFSDLFETNSVSIQNLNFLLLFNSTLYTQTENLNLSFVFGCLDEPVSVFTLKLLCTLPHNRERG